MPLSVEPVSGPIASATPFLKYFKSESPADCSCPFSATLSRASPGRLETEVHSKDDALDHRAACPSTLPVLHRTGSNSGNPSPCTTTTVPPSSGAVAGCTPETRG